MAEANLKYYFSKHTSNIVIAILSWPLAYRGITMFIAKDNLDQYIRITLSRQLFHPLVPRLPPTT